MREHDVTALTARELEQARRELAASLALTLPGSPALVPILSHLAAIDASQPGGTGRTPGSLECPQVPVAPSIPRGVEAGTG